VRVAIDPACHLQSLQFQLQLQKIALIRGFSTASVGVDGLSGFR